jgi:putative glutamine amidotransferase
MPDVTIGITSSEPVATDGAPHPDILPYVRSVERAGATAVSLRNELPGLDELLATLGGLLLTGGVDVEPARYGGNPSHARSQAGRYRPERDAFEMALVLAARERGVPTLCICRGMQIANVAFGGTLVEDLREALGERYTLEHRQTADGELDRADYAPYHDVTLVAGSALGRLVKATSFPTNSMHHQAVRSLGDGLVPAGHTADGVLEAAGVAFPHPFFHAVQWHPEELDDTVSRALFDGLVAAGRSRLPERTR